MKLIIDIPDSAYKVCYDLKNVGDINCLADILVNAVGVGTPIPDNATNGDVIKATTNFIGIQDEEDTIKISTNWWNAPYQKGGKE